MMLLLSIIILCRILKTLSITVTVRDTGQLPILKTLFSVLTYTQTTVIRQRSRHQEDDSDSVLCLKEP